MNDQITTSGLKMTDDRRSGKDRKKRREGEAYHELLQTVKSKSARFLQGKYHHWREVYYEKARSGLVRDHEAGKRVLLNLRVFGGLFQDLHFKERTGLSFGCYDPGIEYVTDENDGIIAGHRSRTFDLFIRGSDGSATFVYYLRDQNWSAKRIANELGGRMEFLFEHEEAMKKDYSLGRTIRFAILLSDREKKVVRSAIQLIGKTDLSRNPGEIHVMEFILEDRTLMGLPAVRRDCPDILSFPGSVLLGTQFLNHSSHDYLTFELCAVRDIYANHIMNDANKPKEMTRRDLEESLIMNCGLSARSRGGTGTRDREGERLMVEANKGRREFARKRMGAIMEMAVDHNMLEEIGSGMGTSGSKDEEKKGDREKRYRIVCQGSDLTTVRKNLYRKYLDSVAEGIAGARARKKAVDEYRKRFPRIDGMF